MITLFSWLRQHLPWLYWACAAVLTPWVFYLYQTQIPSGPAHHLHLLDVGLFLAMAGGLVMTARAYRRRSALVRHGRHVHRHRGGQFGAVPAAHPRRRPALDRLGRGPADR